MQGLAIATSVVVVVSLLTKQTQVEEQMRSAVVMQLCQPFNELWMRPDE